MKEIRLSAAAAMNHKPSHPERTAYRNVGGRDNVGLPNFDVIFKEFPNRQSMMKCIELQRQREYHDTDWKLCKLS